MARHPFNLDIQTLDSFTMLVHGINASGKTYLMGDFLKSESANGPVKFVNVKGEDGMLTLKGMGLGNIAETVESFDDYDAVLNECIKLSTPLQALGVDSLEPLNRWVRTKHFGSDRMPANPDEWQLLHRSMANLMTKQRAAAKYVLCTCVSDKSTDQVTGAVTITPDLPGREARASAGWFDFVAYIQASATPRGVQRTLLIAPNNAITVRQRLPQQIDKDIVLPNGPGGWNTFKAALTAAMGSTK